MSTHYDVVVLGAGPGGHVAAIRVDGPGRRHADLRPGAGRAGCRGPGNARTRPGSDSASLPGITSRRHALANRSRSSSSPPQALMIASMTSKRAGSRPRPSTRHIVEAAGRPLQARAMSR